MESECLKSITLNSSTLEESVTIVLVKFKDKKATNYIVKAELYNSSSGDCVALYRQTSVILSKAYQNYGKALDAVKELGFIKQYN